MLKTVRLAVLLSLSIVMFSSYAPDANALPRDYVEIHYYDCNWNEVGAWIRTCSGAVTQYGQQTGAYRERWSEECSTGNGGTYTVSYNDNGIWVNYNGQVC